jgi:dUTP pyrophosphatase
MTKFEKVSRFKDIEFDMPSRKTKKSAGYDMVVAEDIVIPSYQKMYNNLEFLYNYNIDQDGVTLNQLSKITKEKNMKPTLVSTGVKCYLSKGEYLELSVRSSTPLKYWLILANGVGIIDGDYADNPDNEGEIFFQLINLSPFDIRLKKGDIIGQGIIKKYEVTDDDNAIGDRTGGFGSTSVNV